MARRILRLLGSRYGIAAILLLVVVVVVATARANQDSHSDGRQEDGTVDNVEPGAPDDGYATPTPDESGGPSEAGERLPAAAIDTATAFALAWLDTGGLTDQQWQDRLASYSTVTLREQLAGVSPDSVPATEIRGKPRTEYTNVEFDTDEGLLILRMTEENGMWLVAGIDFQRP